MIPTQEVSVLRVVDGDTLWIQTRQGEQKLRLLGIDAPELSPRHARCSAEIAQGQKARDFVTTLTAEATKIVLPAVTVRDRYQRLLGRLTLEDASGKQIDLATELLKNRFAVKYRRKHTWCD